LANREGAALALLDASRVLLQFTTQIDAPFDPKAVWVITATPERHYLA